MLNGNLLLLLLLINYIKNLYYIIFFSNIPIFIQLDEKIRQLYVGVSQNRNMRIEFNNSQILEPIYVHKYLNGLVDMFKQHVVNKTLHLFFILIKFLKLNLEYSVSS